MSEYQPSSRDRWQWLVGGTAIAAAVVGALISFFISTSSMSVEVASLLARVSSIEAYQNVLTERASSARAEMAVSAAKMIEIETQFCSSDIVRNLMHANDMRLLAIMWHDLHPKETYPTDNAFYPQICNRAITSGSQGIVGR